MQQTRNDAATKLVVKNYWHQMKQDPFYTFVGLLLPGIGTILINYTPPLVIAKLLSKANHEGSLQLNQIWPYVLAFAGAWAAGEIVWRIGLHFTIKSETAGMQRLYKQAMKDLLAKDIAFFHDNFAGSLTKRTIAYGRRFIDVMDNLAFNVSASYLPIIFAVIVLWGYSLWLVLSLVAMMALTGFIVFPFIKKRQRLVALREDASNELGGFVADVIGNADTVKAFSHEALEQKDYERFVDNYAAKAKHSWDYHNQRVDLLTSPFYVATNALGLIIAIALGDRALGSISTIFVAFSYFASVTRTMWEFTPVYRNMEAALTEAAQFTELLLDEPRITDAPQAEPLNIKNGSIELKDIRFRYDDDSGSHLFNDLSLSIAPGEKVAFVGRSGGGKTTITRLLLRFMDIQGGQILIDGQDISRVRQHDLRLGIAYVPQEPAMFHRSLADNIRYGRPAASDKEVIAAAKLAHADEFINKLTHGYDTLVGERGVKLSGGQRQRIAIARAILKDAPVLILDEATSALDSDSERLIQDALWKLMEGKTTIAIAHRLSTIQRMDRIIVLEEGRIAEEGSHKQLLDKGGIYATLWAHQSGGFLED